MSSITQILSLEYSGGPLVVEPLSRSASPLSGDQIEAGKHEETDGAA